jgi:hypothetical protein
MSQRDDEPSSALSKEKPEPAQNGAGEAAQPEEQVKYSMSPGLPAFLGANRIGLAISSYQSGKLYLLGQNADGGLLVDKRFFRKAMGICVPDRETILLATLFQIIKFKNVLEPDQQINHVFDTCYVPRELYVTGELDAHDIGQLADGQPVFVNTLDSCLATVAAPQLQADLEAAVYLQDHQGGPLPSERARHGGRRAALRHCGEQVRHHRWLARPQIRRRDCY